MLEAFAMSDMGCVRTNNEDYCLIEPELGLYVLADGMGGAKAGETASRMAVEAVSEAMLFVTHRDSQVLLRAVEEKREPENSARNNLESLALCFAAISSAARGAAVVPGTVRRLPE